MKFVLSSLVAGAVLGLALSAQAQSVNIYSTRQIDLIEPVLDAFTAKTGIDTEVLFLKKGLVDRVVAEGRGSPADVMLTTDIGGLTRKNCGFQSPGPRLCQVSTMRILRCSELALIS